MVNGCTRREYIGALGAVGGTAAIAGCLDTGGGGGFLEDELLLMNPYPPGGGTDVYFSQFESAFADEFDVDVRQEYEDGAEGAIAHRQMYNEDDVSVLTNINIPLHTLVQIEQDDPNYDLRELTGVAGFAWDSVALLTSAESEYDSFESLREAYQNGDLTSLGGVGSGNTFHMSAWQMKEQWGIEYDEYIGYDGGGTLINGLLGGEIDAGVVGVVPAAQYIQEDEVNDILVAGEEPHPAVPDTDLSADYDLESISDTAIFTRSIFGTPELNNDQQEELTEGILNSLESEAIQNWAEESGNPVIPKDGPTVQEELDTSFGIQEIYDEFRESEVE